jgi:uncharacterized protein (DUF885 family)
MKKRIVLSVLLVLILAASIFIVPTVWFKPWSIEHFYGRTFARFALKHPMLLSQLRILPESLDFHSNDLDDVSIEFQQAEAGWTTKQLEILRSYDRDSLDDPLSYDVLEWFLEDGATAARFVFHGYPLNQLSGIHTGFPDFMINIHQVRSEKDAKNFVARLSKSGTYFDQTVEDLRHRAKLGIVAPRFVLSKVLGEMEQVVATPVDENPMQQHFANAVSALEELDEARRKELIAQSRAEIEKTVIPAYGRLMEITRELESNATDDAGVWKLPEGEAYYAHRLRSSTTTDMNPEEVHRLGLAEVDRIQEEMWDILRAEGVEARTIGEAMTKLGEDPRFTWEDSDAGREEILARFREIVEEVDANIDHLFDARPKTGVEVQRVPQFREASSPAAYYNPAPFDGSKPGTFFANLRNVREHARFGMRTLAYHEAIPGHHFQSSLAQEQTGVPFFRRVIPFTAYAEGWALYAEQLAAENGFQDDPYDRLGYLQSQMFRAVRLVVDTGIHVKRWTREEAITYMLENTGMPESDVTAEVERYIVWPGQACAYKVGQLKILELRERAHARLGERFDIREFHGVVLEHGELPLTILERLVDEWIAAKG